MRFRVKLSNVKWADRWKPLKPINVAHEWYYVEYATDWRESSVATRKYKREASSLQVLKHCLKLGIDTTRIE